MAQPSKTLIERKTFSRGLITEANALTFPENASREEINFTLNRDGSRRRRLGMEYEVGANQNITGSTLGTAGTHHFKTFRWNAVGGVPGNDKLVIYIAPRMYLINLYKGTRLSISATLIYSSSASASTNCRFCSINGNLVFTLGGEQSINIVTPDLSFSTFPVKVRDLWGIDDSLAVDTRPTTLSNEHKYNLLNQGWPSDKLTAVYGTAGNAYPSNADIPTVCTKSDGGWDVNAIDYALFGTTPAPKGKYIIDPFNRGTSRQTASGLTGLLADSDSTQLTSITGYAGRVFVAMSTVSYSAANKETTAPIWGNSILFSQVVESVSDIGKCYQEADPTALNSEGLVASDGGVIKIQEASNIVKLVATNTGLLVFAENGVWMISGPDNIFAADNYSVVKISSVGCIAEDSVLASEQGVFYWADSGIYTLQPDPSSGRYVSVSMTENTIQTLYNDIPLHGKTYSTGIYDPSERKCRWMYRHDGYYSWSSDVRGKVRYTRELIYDLTLQAFYTYEVYDGGTSNTIYVGNYCDSSGYVAAAGEEEVIDSSGVVITNSGGGAITSYTSRTEERTQNVKYLTLREKSSESNHIQFAFSHYRRDDFKDFGIEDAAAYLVTGSEMAGDSFNRKQVNNLILHFNRTETGFDEIDGELVAENASSCLVNSMWDFANSQRANKWGTQFQGYRLKRPYFASGPSDSFDYGWEIITTKNKLRGSGKALALRFETEPEKDCHLLGWVIDMENSNGS